MKLFDPTQCRLGEGPLWLPERKTLLWFDILEKKMLARTGDKTRVWQFDRHHSAAGRLADGKVLLASEDGLWVFDLETEARQQLCPLEADNPVTRSNDGRADPWGGFWIGTMGIRAEPGAGAIYRYFGGALQQVVPGITVSNTICFAPDRSCAYYSDTVTQQIMCLPLDPETGWPSSDPQLFADLTGEDLNPDGAVTDATGTLWVACWDAGCVIALGPDGQERKRLSLPAIRPTCPAFGGDDLTTLMVTSAYVDLTEPNTNQGQTFAFDGMAQGVPEPMVIL